MSNFRTKLLGLAAVATAFAGISYGQTISGCNAAGSYGSVGAASINPSLRAEGETELVADFGAGTVVTGGTVCTSSAGTASAIVVVTASLPVTSKALPFPLTTTEATLIITGVAPVTAPVPYQGSVSGTQVTFTGVTLPAGTFNLQISNIRVNASGASSPQVTETVLVSTTGGNFAINAVPYNAGYILQSLGSTALALGTVNYNVCTGNVYGAIGAPTASFTVNVKELFGGAFKTLNVAGSATEAGSYPVAYGTAGTVGTANTATQILLTLGNVPASATVYVPQSITTAAGDQLTVSNSTIVTTPASIAGVNGVAFTPVSGTVSITYTTTVSVTATGAQTFAIPVYVGFAANGSGAQSAMTALVAYTPQAALTGPATTIPTFAVSTATPAAASVVTACQTTLLFPYVTNATGFETGIAVVNTTTDNLYTAAGGLKPGVTSQASPVNGTCTLNFYGNAAQPTATVTPTLGAYTAAAPTVVPVYANILTSMVGSSGFSGYAIASCNFLEAHGFAFITDTSGTFSGTEGYLATVIPVTRNENGTDATALTLSINTTGLTISGIAGGGVASGTISGTASGTVAPTTGQ